MNLNNEYMFTSESVTCGHPDKICDQISDAVLDAYLRQDPDSRVACEVCANNKKVMVMGEITSKANINVEEIVRNTIKKIGYNKTFMYDPETIEVDICLNTQSPDISMGVNKEDIGAGDQGMMFGYATNETDTFLPYTVYYANMLSKRLEEVRKENIIPYLGPDGKSQVTCHFKDNKLVNIDAIVISTQHTDIDIELLRKDIKEHVIDYCIPKELLNNTKIFINPTGRFIVGGPVGDSGLTGRKIIVDTYGGVIPHGGGAFSGKDYTKVDRTAAYYSRYVCKNLVAAGVCDKIMLQVAYAIGVSKPLSIYIDTYNTNKIEINKIYEIIDKVFDFTPNNMIKELDSKNMKYSDTTCYCHFGKNNLSYEQLNKVQEIKSYL